MTEPNTRDIYGITVRKNAHSDIRRIKKQGGQTAIHGNKFWLSSTVMMDYLQQYPPKKGASLLEVGCGWGISGIFCAKHYQSEVTALDADSAVFDYLHYHAQLNGVAVQTVKNRFEKITTKDLSPFHTLIGSDICFWDEMSEILFKLVKRAAKAGVKRIILTDPGRPPFTECADLCKDLFEDAAYEWWSVPHPYNTSGLVLDITL